MYSVLNQVRQVKPDVLLGLSAVGGLFSHEVHMQYIEKCLWYVFLELDKYKIFVSISLAKHKNVLKTSFNKLHLGQTSVMSYIELQFCFYFLDMLFSCQFPFLSDSCVWFQWVSWFWVIFSLPLMINTYQKLCIMYLLLFCYPQGEPWEIFFS